MPLPSPDRALIALSDLLLAPPQRRGVPLPRLLAGFQGAALAAHIIPGLAMIGLDLTGAALLYAGLVAAIGASGAAALGRLANDARSWSPRLALLYRALALEARGSDAGWRALSLAAVAALTALLPFSGLAGAEGPPLCGALLTLTAAGLARDYARCAAPRDPDASAPRALSALP